MKEREKILRYYRSGEEGDLAAKLLDLADMAQKSHKFRVSEFLDPHGYTVAETVAAHYPDLELVAEGGYASSERMKVLFIHEEFAGEPDPGIGALQITWDTRYYQIGHRDLLGSLLGLGLKRELFGDILVQAGRAQVIVNKSTADYVLAHLAEVGAARVEITAITLDELEAPEEKIKEISTTVASLRLDAIAAAGFGVSRTKMAAAVQADRLKVNWQSAKSPSQIVAAGDILSMRGRGRVEVAEVRGTTKKGRMSILLKRYY